MTNMTKSEALFIKFLRVRLECSWGKLYSHYFNRYLMLIPFTDKEYRVDSVSGRYLCRMAQHVLSENWQDEM